MTADPRADAPRSGVPPEKIGGALQGTPHRRKTVLSLPCDK